MSHNAGCRAYIGSGEGHIATDAVVGEVTAECYEVAGSAGSAGARGGTCFAIHVRGDPGVSEDVSETERDAVAFRGRKAERPRCTCGDDTGVAKGDP